MNEHRQGTLTGILVLTCCLVSGCSAVSDPYQFVSLEAVEGISVVSRGIPHLEGVVGLSAMPMEYALDRDQYVLHFAVPAELCACVEVSVRSKVGRDLRLLRMPGSVGGESESGQYVPSSDKSGAIVFAAYSALEGGQGAMAFMVLERNGRSSRQEIVPFKLETNGFRWYIDWI